MGTYALGTWNTSAKQDKGISRLFNRMNKDVIDAAIAAGTIINAGGSGYSVGNVLTLVDSGTTVRAATFTVTAVNNGAVTAVSLLDKGNYSSHQAANNKATTTLTAGATGCVLSINFYKDVADMCVRNGGILDSAATSYAKQLDDEIQAIVGAAIPTASNANLTSVASTLGVTIPD